LWLDLHRDHFRLDMKLVENAKNFLSIEVRPLLSAAADNILKMIDTKIGL
jgi:hypothetical protein